MPDTQFTKLINRPGFLEVTKEMCPRMSIDEVRRRCDNEWVLLNEVERDPQTGRVLSGQVIEASEDRDVVRNAALELRGPWELRDIAVLCFRQPPPDTDFLL